MERTTVFQSRMINTRHCYVDALYILCLTAALWALAADGQMLVQVLAGDEAFPALGALVAGLEEVNLWLHVSVEVWLRHPFVLTQTAAVLTDTCSRNVTTALSSALRHVTKILASVLLTHHRNIVPYLLCRNITHFAEISQKHCQKLCKNITKYWLVLHKNITKVLTSVSHKHYRNFCLSDLLRQVLHAATLG